MGLVLQDGDGQASKIKAETHNIII